MNLHDVFLITFVAFILIVVFIESPERVLRMASFLYAPHKPCEPDLYELEKVGSVTADDNFHSYRKIPAGATEFCCELTGDTDYCEIQITFWKEVLKDEKQYKKDFEKFLCEMRQYEEDMKKYEEDRKDSEKVRRQERYLEAKKIVEEFENENKTE
jgi:hypothetical protein